MSLSSKDNKQLLSDRNISMNIFTLTREQVKYRGK